MYLLYQGSNLVPQSRSQNFLRFIAAHSLWAHNRSHSISVINSSRNVRWLTEERVDCITPFIRASVLPSVGCRCRQPIALATRQSLLRVRACSVHRLEGVICCPVSRTHAFISRRSSIQRGMLVGEVAVLQSIRLWKSKGRCATALRHCRPICPPQTRHAQKRPQGDHALPHRAVT